MLSSSPNNTISKSVRVICRLFKAAVRPFSHFGWRLSEGGGGIYSAGKGNTRLGVGPSTSITLLSLSLLLDFHLWSTLPLINLSKPLPKFYRHRFRASVVPGRSVKDVKCVSICIITYSKFDPKFTFLTQLTTGQFGENFDYFIHMEFSGRIPHCHSFQPLTCCRVKL